MGIAHVIERIIQLGSHLAEKVVEIAFVMSCSMMRILVDVINGCWFHNMFIRNNVFKRMSATLIGTCAQPQNGSIHLSKHNYYLDSKVCSSLSLI